MTQQIQQPNQQQQRPYLDKNNDGIPDFIQKESIPAFLEANKDLNQFEIDTKEEIESFCRELAGFELDNNSKMWIKEYDPIINNYGIRKIKMHMEALINKHAITTDLKIEEVHQLLQYHISELIRWFKLNYFRCDIKLSDLSSIIAQIDNKCLLVLSRSVGGGQRNAITARTKLTGSANPNAGSFPS